MSAAVKQEAEEPRNSQPKKSRKRIDFCASLKTWILCNYEEKEGSRIHLHDIYNHAMAEKSKFTAADDVPITSRIVTGAILQLWPNVSKARKRQKNTNCTNKKIPEFRNLQRKSQALESSVTCNQQQASIEQRWQQLELGISAVARNAGYEVMINNEVSLSCLRFDKMCFNGQRAVFEVLFDKRDEEKIKFTMKYHQRIVPLEEHPGFAEQLETLDDLQKAELLLSFLSKSQMCMGFVFDVDEKTQEQCELTALSRCHLVRDMTDPSGRVEKRMFSLYCQVIATYSCRSRELCLKCFNLRNTFSRKKGRMANRGDEIHSRCNYRYMTREQLIDMLNRKRKKEQELLEDSESE